MTTLEKYGFKYNNPDRRYEKPIWTYDGDDVKYMVGIKKFTTLYRVYYLKDRQILTELYHSKHIKDILDYIENTLKLKKRPEIKERV